VREKEALALTNKHTLKKDSPAFAKQSVIGFCVWIFIMPESFKALTSSGCFFSTCLLRVEVFPPIVDSLT